MTLRIIIWPNCEESDHALKYEEVGPIPRPDAERVYRDGTPLELQVVVLSVALHETDHGWAESFCAALAAHQDPGVRGNAVLALAHLARRSGRLAPDAVRLVEAARDDPAAYVRKQANAASDDLDHFLGER